jgi:7-carboxy-7-deazaguanine synthase
LKIVVADRADFDWALQHLGSTLAGTGAVVLWSAVAAELPVADLAAWILAAKAPGRLQIQLHKVLWPAIDRGV